jgi:heme-binding NEAT domain protein
MHITKKIMMGLLVSLGMLLMMPLSMNAAEQTVPLSVLKDGTNDTSYAASYFSNSASVTSNGDGLYTVTSTVTTNKNLGNYPVQIISIDGAPANVSKTDNGDTQTITYSYQTNAVTERHAAVIKVDVDNINYHHTYNVGLQLAADSIVRDTKPVTAQAESVKQNTETTNVDSKSENEQSSVKTNERTSTESVASTEQATKEKSESKPVKKQNDNVKLVKQMVITTVCGLLGGILVAVGVIWYTSRKK